MFEVDEQRQRIAKLFHAFVKHFANVEVLDFARQFAQCLQVAFNAFLQLLDVQVGPQDLRPLLTSTLKTHTSV